MKLLALVALTMCAFAGNSVLTRLGVGHFGMDPLKFAVIRVAAGALMLVLILKTKGQALPLTGRMRWGGALSLAIYMFGFSVAYISLGAGLGALILFAVVQLGMFGWAVAQRQTIPPARWVGVGIAFGGLILLLWPAGAVQVPLLGAAAMALAGLGWAAYSLLGQRESAPLAATAANFVLCLPMVLPLLLWPGAPGLPMGGVATAIAAGAIASGLGYALWYVILPHLATTTAAITQLSVPVIAVFAGVVLLAEPLTLRIVIAGGLVLSGIAVSVIRR